VNFRVLGLRQLGSGGNGDVFIGQRNDTGEYVVVKFLREWHLKHAREGFEREIRLLGRGVPGLVRILGWDMSAQPPFYVMPYLEGGALTR
jgi:serine/threonine protein kinase